MQSGGAVPFSIADLFASSEAGAWYGPSDIDTLFQDSAGTTPVTTAGQPVGLMLDKSKGLVRGPELVTNGDFATDTDWLGISGGTNLTIAEGQATFTTSANFRGAFQTANYAAGTWLEIMFDLVSVSAGSVQFVGKSNDNGISGGTSFLLSASSSGSYKAIVLTSTNVSSIAIRNIDSGSTTVIDNVSFANSSATTRRKPRLRRVRHTRLALPAPQLTRLMIACALQYQRAGLLAQWFSARIKGRLPTV